MTTAARLLIVLGLAVAVLSLLLGPAWRGSFYRSWLRPRLLAFGISVALITSALYVVKVVSALRSH